ncbi:MAG: hypothetical protein A2Y00_00850 [Omnitrophica WOR_2 bacterium GWF2_43_52]|nr:MAG: hypothetical protein A2Y01_04235 [Omnitrophica WOR_2 bacterium GWC2_44_8]OGX21010.1 MAG: hypothetical protein A2Y00_00850 [Omnitrophica WOR_2 bacterium GWF2_43_52]OGX58366.1 MAG: hypothetical protein A2460_08145 [Omnitrophica WOR_2 bacterium RIFOXYC2_FULL_43_9]
MIEELFLDPVKNMLTQVGNFVSALGAVILVLLVGWIIAKVIKNLIIRILDILQIDSYAERVGVDKILAKGGIKYSISELIGVLTYWVVMLISLVIAMSAVNLNQQAAGLLNTIVLYIPRVISAIFILVLGLFFASFVNSSVQTAAANTGIEQSTLFGHLAQAIIVVFAIDISLRQLQIDIGGIEHAFVIILGSVGLAFALAFGLGCRDIAAKLTQEFLNKLKAKK